MSKKTRAPRAEKRGEKGEESRIRAYFVRLFGKYDFRNEKHFLYFGKWLIFVVLILVETLLLLQRLDIAVHAKVWGEFFHVSGFVAALTLSMALQLFAVKSLRGKIWFYLFDALLACAFLFFADGTYSIIFYLLVLTQVYFEMQRTKHSVFLLIGSVVLYLFAYGAERYLSYGAAWDLLRLLRSAAGFIVVLVVHYLVVQIALAFYRQYLRLDAALYQLGESKKELEKAYAVAKEVSALEERQRIAKEIHDTAGHSLTTVIMQTEAAKLIVDKRPDEAKSKIVAANLQAKHALEELRNGVHLLSGVAENQTLKNDLTGIVHESTDGTGIKIRYAIADVKVSPTKHRFLCNSLKEGIANGLRHGGATAFWFELKEENGSIQFLLSDNGKGAQGALSLGFGLKTMAERAKSLGGNASFLSEIEEGFEVRLTLPTDGETQGGDYGEN